MFEQVGDIVGVVQQAEAIVSRTGIEPVVSQAYVIDLVFVDAPGRGIKTGGNQFLLDIKGLAKHRGGAFLSRRDEFALAAGDGISGIARIQGRPPRLLRHGQVGEGGRLARRLVETHLVEAAVRLPLLPGEQFHDNGLLDEDVAIHCRPDLVAFGIVHRNDAQLYMVPLFGIGISGNIRNETLEIKHFPTLSRMTDSQGEIPAAPQQLHPHEMALIQPSHQESGLSVAAGGQRHIVVQHETGAVFRKMRLPARNPAGTRPATVHQAGLEPGGGLLHLLLRIGHFHGPVVACAGFQGLAAVNHAHRHVGLAVAGVKHQRAAIRFADQDPI